MRHTRASFVAALLIFLGSAMASPPPAHAGASVAVGISFDSLAPHGQWVVSASFGRVWRPAHVYTSWRPYSDGQWVYTDYGWTFVSDEPWGWATYHYGRWYLDPVFGWVWIPGYEWAPAWVDFYVGSGWIGWAPMPPTVGVRYRAPVRVDPRAYCFVDERHFLSSRVGRYVAPTSRNLVLVRTARSVSRVEREGGRWYNRGPSPRRLEEVTRQRVPRLRVVDVDNPRLVGRGQVRGGEVARYRPRPQLRDSRRPALERSSTSRGHVTPAPPQRGRVYPMTPRRGDVRSAAPQRGKVYPAPTRRGNVRPAVPQHGKVYPAPARRGDVRPAPSRHGKVAPASPRSGKVNPATPKKDGKAAPVPPKRSAHRHGGSGNRPH